MPFIQIKLAKPEPSKEQKAKLVQKITQDVCEILGKKPDRVMVMIEALEQESIGIGGVTVEELNKNA